MPEARTWYEKYIFDPLTFGERVSAATAASLLYGEDWSEAMKNRVDYQDIIEKAAPEAPTMVKRGVGFLAGVAFDPLTYIGVGQLAKGAKLAKGAGGATRNFLQFAHQPILPQSLDKAIMKGFRGSKDWMLQTKGGEIFGKGFLPGYLTKHRAHIYLNDPSEANIAMLKELRPNFFETEGRYLQQAKADIADYAARVEETGMSKELKTEIFSYLEMLKRDTPKEFAKAFKQVKEALGDEFAEVYRITGESMRRSEQWWIENSDRLTLEKLMNWREKMKVEAYMPHVLTMIRRNPIKYFRAKSTYNKMRDVLGEEKLLDVMDAADAGITARKKAARAGSILKKTKMSEKSRKYLGEAKAINKEMKNLKDVDDFFNTDLVGAYSVNARSLASAKAAKEYLTKLRELVGKPKGHGLEGYEYLTKKQDPLGIFNGYEVPKDLIPEILNTTHNALHLDDVGGLFLKTLDSGTDWFRTVTLFPFPSYHFRNMVGDLWNMYVKGGVHLADMGESWGAMRRIALDKATPEDITLFRELSEHGVADTGMAAEVLSETPAMWREAFLNGSPNPMSRHFYVTKAGQWIANVINNGNRGALYLSRRRAGMDAVHAAAETKSVLFDYTRAGLTEFENNYMRRLVPFYRWSRNNIPYQIKMMVEKPGKYASLLKFKNTIEYDQGPLPYKGWMSEWMKENDPVHLDYDEKTGEHLYFFLRNWLPADDLLIVADPLNDVLSMINPWIKEPIQQLANVDWYFEDEITELPTDMNPFGGHQTNFLGMMLNRRLVHTLRNLRMLNELDRTNVLNIFGEERPHHQDPSMLARIIRASTGMRLYPYDPRKSAIWWEHEFERKVANLKGLVRKTLRQGYTEEAARYQAKLFNLMQTGIPEDLAEWQRETQPYF
jgi:hypothetical protein